MPRNARVIAVGLPHHVTQRGNNQQNTFIDDHDRNKYLNWISKYSKQYGLRIWAYCLMTNHVHFIVVPEKEDSMAKTFAVAHTRYSLYFNVRHQKSGHLWQGRYFSSVLDDRYLLAAVRYVERNPIRAGLVIKGDDYLWSSAKPHVHKVANTLLSHCPLLEDINSWSNYIADDDDPLVLEKLNAFIPRGQTPRSLSPI